jgi:serine/threonine-protein kinase
MLSSGTRLGRYEVLFPLARGGMAGVYAGRTVGEGKFRKPVALKVPLPELAKEGRFVEMLMDEANLSSCITSPWVVQTLDLGREGPLVYLAMELVVGAPLRALEKPFQREDGDPARAGGFPLSIGLAILVQAARGLHDAHEARGPKGEALRLVHRDVSPHNVLVGVDGRARIADFGIAHAAHRLTQTRSGELKGKLSYFAPEQLVGEQVDRRVDVFALGVVAYELLTGVRPFDGDNPLAIAMNVAQKSVEPVSLLRPDVPRAVSDAIGTAMLRDKARRYESCAAFADALEAAAASAGGLARSEEVGRFVRESQGDRIARLEDALALAAAGDDLAELADELEAGLDRSDRDHAVLEGSLPTIATYQSAPAAVRVSAPPPPPPRASSEPVVDPGARSSTAELVLEEASRGNVQLDLSSMRRSRPSIPEVEPAPPAPPPPPRVPPAVIAGAVALVVVAGAGIAFLGLLRLLAIALLVALGAGVVVMLRRAPRG